jgi:outer membrane protein assembly factor BamB
MRPLPTVRTVLRAAACAVLLVLVAAACQPDVNMINADPLGTGAYPDESPLAPSNLTPTGFGQLFASTLDGQVYAQPLVNNGTLLAVTEHNSAYGLDPVTGATKWHTNYGTPWNPADLSCGDLVPEVGITGTPVIDPKTHHAYFTSKT